MAEISQNTLAPIKAAWTDREHRRVVLNPMFDLDREAPSGKERLRQQRRDLTMHARERS